MFCVRLALNHAYVQKPLEEEPFCVWFEPISATSEALALVHGQLLPAELQLLAV